VKSFTAKDAKDTKESFTAKVAKDAKVGLQKACSSKSIPLRP
jgi:hypothetical protein